MSPIHRTAAVAIAVVFLLVSATGAMAGDGRSFRATFAGTAATDGLGTSTFVGSGQASHLGHISTMGQAVASGPAASCAGGVANINDETLEAPDGSTLTIRSDDDACPTGPYQFHGTGTWTVVAGTGRFAHTRGSGFLAGGVDFAAGTFSVTLQGVLD